MNTIGSRTTRTEEYPLPYSEFCLPIVSGKGYVGGLNYGFGIGVTNFGLTSVTIANNCEDASYRWTGYTYVVVGAQPQWGYWAKIPSTTHIWIYPVPVNAIYGLFAQREKDSTSINIEGSLIRRKSLIDCDINFAAGTSDPNAGFAILIAS